VVLSQCFVTPLRHDPFDLYRALRLINPSPYMFYLDQGDMKLVGAFPNPGAPGGRPGQLPAHRGTRPGAPRPQKTSLEAELLADPRSGPST